VGTPLHLTFELYVTDQQGVTRFEPLTCPQTADVLQLVQRMLDERKLASIEVRRFGEPMFILSPPTDPGRG
jgi:hypothetical protein